MKSLIKFLAVIAFFLAVNVTANAQRGDRQSLDPEQMAEQQTTRMVEQLSLNDTQAAQIQQINLAYAQKTQEAQTDNEGNRDAMKEIRAAIDKEKNAELQQVLTAEQFQTYEAAKAEKGSGKRKGKRGGQEGSRS